MKLIILQEKLKQGIKTVEKISAKSLSLPILNNILIKTKKNFLNLVSTNLEIGINWWSLAETEKEGEIVIPTQIFSNFINLLPNKKVFLEKKDLSLDVKCENYKTVLKGFKAEEFPIIPQITEGEFILVNSQLFCQNLNQVVNIPISSTTKPEISGIYFEFQKDLIKMVATDSFRLGEKTFELKTPSALSKTYSLILPQRTAKEIINIFGERQGTLKIYFSSNQVLFELPMIETNHPEIQLISRLIDGEYPNYEAIIPKKYETQVIFQKEELINQIKSASLFSGKINEIKLKVDSKNKKVEIFGQSPDLGEYCGSLTGNIKGKDVEVSFNHRFFLDGLLNIKSPEVIFEINNKEEPGVLKPIGDANYIYVVMPIKAT
ncbi:DNA polymerase III subunit beta [Candidatus Parcubacteria bacterium]|nr:DNA polymerase III subunit beta [Candidatus Parcubacteria bacterium]